MSDLASRRCKGCEGELPALNRAEAEDFLDQLSGWQLTRQGKGIAKEYAFKDFAKALEFANRIGDIAEEEGHHPDLTVSWGKLGVSLTTHSVQGLTENDFILAAKIDAAEKQAAYWG